MKGCSPCCVLFIPPKHGECAVPQNLGLHHNIDFFFDTWTTYLDT